MTIRTATDTDRDAIHALYLSAFSESERESVAHLAVNLLLEITSPPVISLVAEMDGAPVGHIAFSPIRIDCSRALRGYLLAPLAVDPSFQKKGCGSKLIQEGVHRLKDEGINVLIVYGDPAYYGRFGFTAEAAVAYRPPYPLLHPFGWQAMILNPDYTPVVSGRVTCVPPLCEPTLW